MSPAFDPNKHRFTCPSNEDNTAFVRNYEEHEKFWLHDTRTPKAPQHLASTRAKLTMARTADRSFGTVHASSGLRTIECEEFASNPADGKPVAETGKPQLRFILDWCLLALHPSRGMSNDLPSIKESQTPYSHSIVGYKPCSQWTVMNNPKCDISKHQIAVAKFGRTSAYTYGTINAVPMIMNPGIEQGELTSISDTCGLTVKDCCHSMEFMAHEDGAEAVKPGDSGSILLHAPLGDWLGLIFGKTSAGAALFTPIDLVLRDIEQVTGLKVVEPDFNGDCHSPF